VAKMLYSGHKGMRGVLTYDPAITLGDSRMDSSGFLPACGELICTLHLSLRAAMGADDEDEAYDDKNHAEECGEEFSISVEKIAAVACRSPSNGKDKCYRDIYPCEFEPRSGDFFVEEIDNNKKNEGNNRKVI